MELSVIIVSYNTRDKLHMCLESVFASKTDFSFEVFVVDNNSRDGSVEMVRRDFPQVKPISNEENLGFSRANNQAIALSQGNFVLLLNSDVKVMSDTFAVIRNWMAEHPEVGIAGCRVEKPDGSLDLACRRSFPDPKVAFYRLSGLSRFFPKSKFAAYNLTYAPENEVMEVDSVMGAFQMISRPALAKIGNLDENFFMYGEDLDWCFRAKEAGYKVMYVPLTKVIHYKGSSSRRAPRKSLYEFHRAMSVFYDKHYRTRYGFFMNLFVKAGIWSRYLVKYFQNALRSEKVVSK